MITTNTQSQTLTQALSHFVSFEDHKNERQWKLNDEASMDLSKLVMEMHDEEMPNNWRFDTIVDIFYELKGKETETINTFEVADNLVDVYNLDLKKWVATHSRDNYIDEGIEEGLIDSNMEKQLFVDLIRKGQFICIEQMVRLACEYFNLEHD
jgi:hypothetical protein